MSRLVGLLLACLFLVAPSADALCRASCMPASVAPSCHEQAGSPERLHPASSSSCQREVVIAAPVLDGRRELVAPTTLIDSPADAWNGPIGVSTARRARPSSRGPGTTSGPRRLVLRI